MSIFDFNQWSVESLKLFSSISLGVPIGFLILLSIITIRFTMKSKEYRNTHPLKKLYSALAKSGS